MFVHKWDVSYTFASPALWPGPFRYCRQGGFSVLISIEDIWHYMGFGAIHWNHNRVIIQQLYCDIGNHSGLLMVWATSLPFVLGPVKTHTVAPLTDQSSLPCRAQEAWWLSVLTCRLGSVQHVWDGKFQHGVLQLWSILPPQGFACPLYLPSGQQVL